LTQTTKSLRVAVMLCSMLFFVNAGGASALDDGKAGGSVHAFPPGARAYGMGGAFVAVADDASALYWNPAGLAGGKFGILASGGLQEFGKLQELELVIDSVDTWDGEEDEIREGSIDQRLSGSLLGALQVGPVAFGALGEGWADATVREHHIKVEDHEGHPYTWGGGENPLDDPVPAGTLEYRLLLGGRAGVGFKVLDLGAAGSLAFGVAGTYYAAGWGYGYRLDPTEKITIPDPPPSGKGPTIYAAREWEFHQAQGYAIDLGVKARLTPWITAGAVAHNVVHSLTWKGSETETTAWLEFDDSGNARVEEEQSEPSSLDPVVDRPMRYQVGVAVTPPLLGLTLAADLDSEQVVHLGAEWRTLFGILALRAGYLTPLKGDELPAWYGAPVRLGAGVGLPFLRLNAAAGFKSWDDLAAVQDVMVELSLHF